MSLREREIAAVVAELAPLARSRVDSVRLHAERAFTLELFGRAGAATLLISAEPDRTRLHVVERRPSRPAGAGDQPHPFQAVLRRELEGARLEGIRATPGERVVELTFERPQGAIRLIAELTGRHGNVFLVGTDGVILASAVRNQSRRRDLSRGKPYQLPEEREEPREVHHDQGAGEQGGPPPYAASPRGAGAEPRFPISAALEERYRALEQERAEVEGRRRLREPLRAGVARARRALEKLEQEAARVPAAEEDRRSADLLKQNLHAVPRGAREVVLTEWTAEGRREVKVALDPALGPRENMERHYRRYRRIVESATRVSARAEDVRRRLEEQLALLDAVSRARLEDLPRLEREARALGAGPRPPPRPRSKRDEPVAPYRRFRSLSGAPLLAGRNAEGNDALTVSVTRGNDLWLHARGRNGAHVVARLEKGRPPDGETLLDAAHLAAHFSEARGEPQVEVVATRAKYVRKVKGAAPGAVTYSQERTILLRLEPARIERLLATEEE
jgi:predicted ribosome quality control (RQC) complex YloA/Tae2 family protein